MNTETVIQRKNSAVLVGIPDPVTKKLGSFRVVKGNKVVGPLFRFTDAEAQFRTLSAEKVQNITPPKKIDHKIHKNNPKTTTEHLNTSTL